MLKDITKKEFAALAWPEDEGMQKFIEKETFEVVPLVDGYYSTEKARIETRFCFPYGYCGVTSTEEMDSAFEMAEAAKNYKYFIKENLKDKFKTLRLYKEALKNKGEMFIYGNRFCLPAIRSKYMDNENIKHFEIIDSFYCQGNITADKIIESSNINRNNDSLRPATLEELKIIIEAEKRQIKDFIKRLKSYWKRYGASKLKTWAFLSD